MLLRRTTTTSSAAAILSLFATAIRRHFSKRPTTSNLPKPFSKIPWKHRSRAIQESQKALTDYLHTTRALPFPCADHIASNSPHSLWKIVSEIPFSPSTFGHSFQRFLRYHPINELDFFLESIGLNCDGNGIPRSLLPPNSLFLSDWKHFDVVCALAAMGFPWSKLGLLYKEEQLSIFEIDPSELQRKINGIKSGYGLNSVSLIGICLAFPRVLYSEMDGLLSDLKVLFLDHDLLSYVDGNVDAVLEVCEKIRLFYDLGCEMGKIGEVMGRSKRIFVEHSKEVLMSKIEYFCKLNVQKDQIGLFLLSRPEMFGFDLEGRVISVSGFLEHFGMEKKELESLKQKYPHVFGRNRIANLPYVMRSMNLGEWFFERMKTGDHSLLATYTIRSVEDDVDKHYMDNLTRLRAKRTYTYAIKKLNFLHSIGFGENRFAVKALYQLNSSDSQLHRRFDCLLNCGIEYSKLCAMVKLSGKILNQQESILEKKLEFLCNDMGSSLQYLDGFPAYLCYDLEQRIKPRFKLHKWLVDQGLCEKEYSLATIIATSEKTFVARLSRIHPDATKKWQENSLKNDGRAAAP
ncbi:Transcription termination factor MTEF18, mitochondrial [Sesamum alatum]|uniref:Transcription termination factor MTEF18, mitochondrial n=1 Tax=Sesamum alatum TaxID=300844 RepID=A0AAE2CBG6_9LAMI|nr:Transcription termination factor MTEF18, mitochondrial [Sesamum alatum]